MAKKTKLKKGKEESEKKQTKKKIVEGQNDVRKTETEREATITKVSGWGLNH